jgi:hypothetical protein
MKHNGYVSQWEKAQVDSLHVCRQTEFSSCGSVAQVLRNHQRTKAVQVEVAQNHSLNTLTNLIIISNFC